MWTSHHYIRCGQDAEFERRPKELTGYVLEAGSAPGAANLAVVPLSGTQFVATGVPPGTYSVRVRAVNGVGSGPATADVVVVVP